MKDEDFMFVETFKEGFMFFETFKEDIDNFRKMFGVEEAEKLALDIIYYGVTGERKTKKDEVNPAHNILMINIQIHIDKSKERFERAIKENEKNELKKRYYGKKKSITCGLN